VGFVIRIYHFYIGNTIRENENSKILLPRL